MSNLFEKAASLSTPIECFMFGAANEELPVKPHRHYFAEFVYMLDGTDVIISLTDPGWCRTDLGGQHAPNAPESSLPGVVVGAFVNDKISGRNFAAGNFHGMTLEQAVEHAEKISRNTRAR